MRIIEPRKPLVVEVLDCDYTCAVKGDPRRCVFANALTRMGVTDVKVLKSITEFVMSGAIVRLRTPENFIAKWDADTTGTVRIKPGKLTSFMPLYPAQRRKAVRDRARARQAAGTKGGVTYPTTGSMTKRHTNIGGRPLCLRNETEAMLKLSGLK